MHLRAASTPCVLVTYANAATASESCLMDLAVIPAFLLENDTGAKDELASWGQVHFDDAMGLVRGAKRQAVVRKRWPRAVGSLRFQ
jgi:hypothetical protein